jgi:hypothetical protein
MFFRDMCSCAFNPRARGVCVCVCVCVFLTQLVRNGHLEVCSKVGIMSSKSLCTLVNYFCLFLNQENKNTNLLLCFCAFDSIEPKLLLVLLPG